MAFIPVTVVESPGFLDNGNGMEIEPGSKCWLREPKYVAGNKDRNSMLCGVCAAGLLFSFFAALIDTPSTPFSRSTADRIKLYTA